MRPTVEFSSIRQVIAEIKVQLRIEYRNTDDLFLKLMVTEAAKEMGTKQDFLNKCAELEVDENFCACLPSDFVILGVNDPGKPPIEFYRACTCEEDCTCTNWFCPPSYNIQNNCIYFSNNIGTSRIRINYTAVNLAPDGTVRIPSNNVRPIKAYAMWQWMMAEQMSPTIWNEHKSVWTKGKLAMRGLSKLLDPQDKARLHEIMNFSYDQLYTTWGNNIAY